MIVNISKKVIEFIFAEETGGKNYYDNYASHPTWPKGNSGITVGGGVDLGYATPAQIRSEWNGIISEEMIRLMQSVCGLKGQKAANALTARIRNGIHIPYEVAYRQYISRVIVGEIRKTVAAFPQAEKLNADTLGVLTSVVYNRGADMTDNDVKAQDRKEMRAIKALVPKKDYKGIAAQIRSMKRLWDGLPDYVGDKEQKFGGLVSRRDKEADIVVKSERIYRPEEIQVFTI